MSEESAAPKPKPYRTVPLEYAGIGPRALALAADFLILAAVSIPMALTGDGIYLLIPVAIAYLPLMWWRRGATLGQRSAGIRVVRASDGRRIELWRALLRGAVWWLDFTLIRFYVGILGFLLVVFEPRKRALHDIVARTVVVFDESPEDVARAFREPGTGIFDDFRRGISGRRKGRS